jgi:hypothetical protein
MQELANIGQGNVIGHHGIAGRDDQAPHTCAVIMPSILRPSIVRAMHSIYAQTLTGTIQVMVGLDGGRERVSLLQKLIDERPDHVAMTVLDPGYSTSRQRGGMHGAFDGGALRTILSYAANSALLANLDDDNWWAPEHLEGLVKAIHGKDWAYCERWFVAPDGDTVLCRDTWESVGPGKGIFLERFGGFSDTNTMLIDKTRVEHVLRLWGIPIAGEEHTGIGSDRNVFAALKGRPFGASGLASSYYVVDADDAMQNSRACRVREALGRDFDGFQSFAEGRFTDAADAFQRYMAIGPRSGLALAWIALTRLRAGIGDDRHTLCAAPRENTIGDARDHAIDALTNGCDLDTSLSGRELCTLAFFSGQHALLDGDKAMARKRFTFAVESGGDQQEARAARAELRRLESG